MTGLDISDAMLDSARHRAAACGASVEWCRASAESLPYDSGTFDIVLAVTILCFIRDPLQVVREVSRVLRPGGSFVSLVGVQYAEAFQSRSPLLVDDPEVFLKTRFG